jgi:hypothetical protein
MIKGFRFSRIFLSFLLLAGLEAGLGSCGIETYRYLDHVASGITMQLNTTAYVRLPAEPYYFRYFIIYYRIYISDLPVDGVDTGLLQQINSALYTDYNFFQPYTNTESTVAPTNMGSIFSGRKYFALELDLENGSMNNTMDNVLSITGGGTITLDFAANTQYKPSLIVGDIRVPPAQPYRRYQLARHRSNANYPYNDNFSFVNSEDINNGDLISSDSSNINQDVQRSAQSIVGPKYTYVSMYIVAHGLDDSNFTNIYSIPTFIGIFRLPNN